MRSFNLVRVLVLQREKNTVPEALAEAALFVAGKDLFQSLELAVDILGVVGWEVIDLLEFRIDVRPHELTHPALIGLYAEARLEDFSFQVFPATTAAEPLVHR